MGFRKDENGRLGKNLLYAQGDANGLRYTYFLAKLMPLDSGILMVMHDAKVDVKI